MRRRGSQKLTKEEFIQRSIKKHGEFYDYTKSVYNGSKQYITIVCPKHGKFKQKANNHLNGYGCRACGGGIQMSQKEFLKRCKKAHGSFYDYSLAKYIGANKRVTIICPVHGKFEQRAMEHMLGHTCKKCNGNKTLHKPYEEVKKLIAPFKIRSGREYKKWWNKNKEYCQKIGIPKSPDAYYQKHK